MEFFEEFSWAVPVAYASALAVCRFEEGDTLYDHRAAYAGSWKQARPRVRRRLQVRFPPASVGARAAAGEGVFLSGWGSPVEIDLWDLAASDGDHEGLPVETTQGRLFTLLWKGDPAALESEADPPPPLPSSALRPRLLEVEDAVRCALGKDAGGGHVFLMPVDRALAAQVLKARAVHAALQGHAPVRERWLRPGDLGLEADFLPTLAVCAYATPDRDPARVIEDLKSRLYKPARGRKTDVDRFNLAKHGHLFSLDGAAG